jgi:hypothetical protein
MACCILVAVMIGAVLATKHRLLGARARKKGVSPLTWRLRAQD